MSAHEAAMLRLMSLEIRRQLKESIDRLLRAEVAAELRSRRLSVCGSDKDLKDRLLRYMILEAEPSNGLVPIYERDLACNVLQEIACEVSAPETSKPRRRAVPRRKRRPAKARTPPCARSEREGRGSEQKPESERQKHEVPRAPVVAGESRTSYSRSSSSSCAESSSVEDDRAKLMTSDVHEEPAVWAARTVTTTTYTTTYATPITTAAVTGGNQLRAMGEAALLQLSAFGTADYFQSLPQFSVCAATAMRGCVGEERPTFDARQAEVTTYSTSPPSTPARDVAPTERRSPAAVEVSQRPNRAGRENLREEIELRALCAGRVRGERRENEMGWTQVESRKKKRERRVIKEREKPSRERVKARSLLDSESECERDSRRRLKRSRRRCSSSSNDSDSSVWSPVSSSSSAPRKRSRSSRAGERSGSVARLYRHWGLKFSGEEKNEEPEDFLELLEDCRDSAQASDRELIKALPMIFGTKARRWFRTRRSELKTWAHFKKAFKRQFMRQYDHDDLEDDLKRRTQGKGERISEYLTCLRYIASKFARPPSERELLKVAFKGILPTYRNAIAHKAIKSLSALESHCRVYERLQELNSRYTPPPPPEKMRVPGGGFVGASTRGKVTEGRVAATTVLVKPKREPESQRKLQETACASEEKEWTSDEDVAMACAVSVHVGDIPEDGQPDTEKCSSASQQSRCKPGQFTGVCFACHGVGHRAFECPKIVCFHCRKKGHRARDCSARAPREKRELREVCQVCDAVGTTFWSCPKCASWRARLASTRAVGQK